MELELNDPRRASTVYFDFIAYRSPLRISETVRIPTRFFFTCKFFTFPFEHTAPVHLRGERRPEEEIKQPKGGMLYNLARLNADPNARNE